MPGLANSKRWSLLAQHKEVEQRLAAELGLGPLTSRVLAARGLSDADEVRRFLNPSLERDWADPLCIPGMAEATDRVDAAIAHGETIAVFGDFDVDGMSATCILTLGLRSLGARVFPYIPHRFGEGYGLSQAALGRVCSDCDPDLVVTVDNGIAAAHEVAWLVEQGVDVVITDHHEPSDLVPKGVPVTDPKLSPDCPSRELAGAGVALKLLCVLGTRHGQPDLWRGLTDVAALGTLSDMMLLQGENRSLVADGIARMRVSPRPGLAALSAVSGHDIAQATADGLPFSIIPRLNAAGRMGTTDVAFDLLMAQSMDEATRLAAELEAINNDRRQTEAALAEEALAQAAELYAGGRSVVVAKEGWHEGVKGIVASRLVSRYHVPAIVFTIQDGVARGSGRSVGQVDLFHAVEQCASTLIRFGGHAGAVGVTCEESRLDDFRAALEQALSTLPEDQFIDKAEVTAPVRLSELTVENIAELDRLQPFGQGNKKPVLSVCGVAMKSRALVGADGAHLRFYASDGIRSVSAIQFRAPDPQKCFAWDGAVDVVFEAINETWQGRTKPKLMVKEVFLRDSREGRADADSALEAPGAHAHLPLVRDTQPAAAFEPALASLDYASLTAEVKRRLIGEAPLLALQGAALERLGSGRSCMAVMATGRGKSLVFHLHAAREAIAHGRASIFVYPLRALVADQAYHLDTGLGALGINVEVLTGETPQSERDRIFSALAAGTAHIVLTTPEFLAIHTARFAASGRVGFVAVDEAHHAGRSKSGDRSAYLELPRIRADLGNPVCLAVTATASAEVASEVCRLLGIAQDDVLSDSFARGNLVIDDLRNLHDRETALINVVATGEKCVVYTNTRDSAVSLTRTLRRLIPELASSISFYHAGLPRDVRARVERAFRAGDLCCVVSTSAFGEGVNLPNIRHVVLYTLPFGSVEFNQSSGRAGRDGASSCIHLLFSSQDKHADERIISSAAPARADLVVLYRTLTALAASGAPITQTDEEIAQAARASGSRVVLDPAEVSSGLGVFSELGFCEVAGFGDGREVRMRPHPDHMELTESVRYLEGLRQREAFEEFARWALNATAEELLAQIVRPIAPGFGTIVE